MRGMSAWCGHRSRMGKVACVAVALAVMISVGGSPEPAAADVAPTVLVVTVPSVAVAGAQVLITAQLTVTGLPVSGQIVSFDTGDGFPHVCNAITNSEGNATCLVVWATAGNKTVSASFDGNFAAELEPSNGTAELGVGLAQTALQSSSASPSPAVTNVPVLVSTTFVRTSAPAGPIGGVEVRFELRTSFGAILAVCTSATDATGHASCSLTPTARGANIVTISVPGSAGFSW